VQPAVPLLAWQKRYVEDASRWKLLVKSVQTGGSFASTLECVLDCLERPTLWIMLSASDRQSKELMEKVGQHSSGAGVVIDSGFFAGTSITQHEARFPNRSRIISLPANPDTARGFAGNVLLDEFAMHRDARSIWAAMVGRATRGYRVRVLSSFKGTANKFYELAKDCGLHLGVAPEPNPTRRGVWSGHWVDIYAAKAQGLDVDIDEIREAVADEEIFAQEYCCVPMSSAEEFIPLDLVLGCESEEASLAFDFIPRPGLFAGMDIGRTKDLSVIWIAERRGEMLVTRGVITLDRMPFAQQADVARSVVPLCERFLIDAGGIGAMLAETLHNQWPWIVGPVQFTAPIKERLAVEAKRQIEERALAIPESRAIRRAIQSVKRTVTPTGNMRFDAARTDKGHADEFWALALAISAAGGKSYVPAADCDFASRTVAAGLMEAAF